MINSDLVKTIGIHVKLLDNSAVFKHAITTIIKNIPQSQELTLDYVLSSIAEVRMQSRRIEWRAACDEFADQLRIHLT